MGDSLALVQIRQPNFVMFCCFLLSLDMIGGRAELAFTEETQNYALNTFTEFHSNYSVFNEVTAFLKNDKQLILIKGFSFLFVSPKRNIPVKKPKRLNIIQKHF